MPGFDRGTHAGRRTGLHTHSRSLSGTPQATHPFATLFAKCAWLNVTSGSVTLPQQAADLQRGLGGLARTLAMKVPSTIINHRVTWQGRRTDGVTYIMYLLSSKF
eukprot:8365809-Pyramimonas_sp.AAC.2